MKKGTGLWILAAALVFFAAQPQKVNPRVTSFQINNGAESTLSRTVTLNNTVTQGTIGPRGGPDGYRADERSDFAHNPDWKAYSSAPTYEIWTSGEGVKTIYFQVKWGNSYSAVVSDTITLRKLQALEGAKPVQILTADPKILSANVTITRTGTGGTAGAPNFIIDISYTFEVNDVPNADKLAVDVLAMQEEGFQPEATRHHRYAEGTRTGSAIRHDGTMTIVIPHLFSPVAMGQVLFTRLQELVKFVISIPSDYGYRDISTGNNQITKEIRFNEKSEKDSKEICGTCVGLPGTGGEWTFRLDDPSQLAWLAGSILRLRDCGGPSGFNTNEIKCDVSPQVPAFGERGVRWTTRPTLQSRQGQVHWWCEGYANGLKDSGCLFFFEVETKYVEPAVVDR